MKRKVVIGLFYIAGLIFLTLGISMMIIAQLGIGPWDALYVALAARIGLTIGSWVFIAGFILIFVNAYLLRRTPDFSALLTIFLIGVFIDVWVDVILAQVVATTLLAQAVMLIGGIVLIAIGVSLYLQSDFARNPIDNLMMAVHYRTGKSMSFAKTSIELVVLLIAFSIGGPIGIGTIVVAVTIGPLIQGFYKLVSKGARHLMAN
ncbi:hypothetical protein SAMN05421736_101917 [Evansella caseinilytica]|uniref:Membrane protein YczE n=1 Tax=Evansella caseinilytica TaxID=1503961 RepID=A0A1H3ISP8_9BACI|nr:membrane protein [Evansella caseinilytica]SDY30711.1 hypothetical protein SAMN05421736_101917 [Evansella caseinilytica]